MVPTWNAGLTRSAAAIGIPCAKPGTSVVGIVQRHPSGDSEGDFPTYDTRNDLGSGCLTATSPQFFPLTGEACTSCRPPAAWDHLEAGAFKRSRARPLTGKRCARPR